MSNQCSPDTDVAGIGDVVAFVIACILASAAAGYAASCMWHRDQHRYSPLLDALLTGLSNTQLIFGCATLFALWRRHHHGFSVSVIKNDPYYHLIVYMLLANVSSGFGCALALGLNGDRLKAFGRAVVYLAVIVFYCVLLIIGYAQDRTPNSEFCFSLLLTVIGVFSNTLNVWNWWQNKFGKRVVILNVVVQVGSTALGLIFTILLRWNWYGEQVEGCNLNSPENNRLSYGQVIAMVLTGAIFIQVFDAFYDNLEDPLAKSVFQRLGPKCYERLLEKRQQYGPPTNETHGGIELESYTVVLT